MSSVKWHKCGFLRGFMNDKLNKKETLMVWLIDQYCHDTSRRPFDFSLNPISENKFKLMHKGSEKEIKELIEEKSINVNTGAVLVTAKGLFCYRDSDNKIKSEYEKMSYLFDVLKRMYKEDVLSSKPYREISVEEIFKSLEDNSKIKNEMNVKFLLTALSLNFLDRYANFERDRNRQFVVSVAFHNIDVLELTCEFLGETQPKKHNDTVDSEQIKKQKQEDVVAVAMLGENKTQERISVDIAIICALSDPELKQVVKVFSGSGSPNIIKYKDDPSHYYCFDFKTEKNPI